MKENIGNEEDKKPERKIWVWSLIFIISTSRIGNGLFQSLSGPTLLYLADNVDATVSQVSSIFTGRSAGFFVGSVVCGLLLNRIKNYPLLSTIGGGVILNGALVIITPWVTNLAGLVIITTVSGMMFGYLDSGMQSLYLQLWGEKKSRPHIQSFHFFFGVGALLAPIIAAPFLEMADSAGSTDQSCPSDSMPQTTTTASYNTTTQTTPKYDNRNINPVGWSYVISGTFIFLTGIAILILVLLNVEEKVKQDQAKETERRTEEPVRDLIWLFLPVCFYYFMVASSETVYQSYIYSIVVCSDLEFSVSQASSLNTLFWVGFCVGRGSGIFYSEYFHPHTMIVFDFCAITLSLIVMSIFGEFITLIPWFVSFYYGLFVATLYSSGVSRVSQFTNVSATYIFVFGIGNTIGQMTMLPLGGVLFDLDPFYVIYQVCAMTILGALSYFWLTKMGERHLKWKKSQSTLELCSSSTRL